MKTPTNSKYIIAVFTFVVSLVALFLLPACGRKQANAANVPRVGIILPQTGLLGEIGHYEKNAFDLAFEKLEASGGKHFTAIFEDGRSDKAAVAAAANKLVDIDGVKLLVTSTTGASLAAQPVTQRAGLPQLAFCMGSEVARSSATTVRFYIGVEEEADAIINFAKQKYANKKIAILHASEAQWTSAVQQIYKPQLEQVTRQPVEVEQYDVKDKDFRSQIERLREGHPALLIILGYGFEFGPLFEQLHQSDILRATDVVGGWGFLYTPVPASQLEGVYVAGPMYIYEKSPAGEAFDAAYLAKYGKHANFDAAFAYELAYRIPDVLRIIAEHGASELKARLAALGEQQGVFGNYHFAPDGNMVVDTAVGRYHNGLIVKD